MSNFISHENAGRYSVANTAQILVFNVDFDSALSALLGAGVAANEAVAVLDNPAPASEWFPTILSALHFTIEDAESVVETLPTSETTDQLEAKLLDVSEQVHALAAQFQAEQQRAARKERIELLESRLERNIPAYRDHLQRNTLVIGTLDDETVRQILLRDTAAGQELMRLRRANNG